MGIVEMCITGLNMGLWKNLFAGCGEAVLGFSIGCEQVFP